MLVWDRGLFYFWFLNPIGHYSDHVKIQPMNITQLANIQKLLREHNLYTDIIELVIVVKSYLLMYIV